MNVDFERLNPFYTQQIILNLLTLLIPVILLIQAFHRKHRTPEIRIFIIMCFTNIVLCLSTAYESYAFLHALELTLFTNVLALISYGLNSILPIALVLLWLLFIEYTLHQSRDIIRRRYPAALIPFFAGIAIVFLSLLSIVVEAIPEGFLIVVNFLNQFVVFIWAAYILASYIVLFREKKRKKIPEYIRLTPTVIAFILGYVLVFFTRYRLVPLGYAVGLIFVDYFMFRRLSFIDPESGFYNEKYLTVLSREAEKKQIRDASVIRFKSPEDRNRFAEILRSWAPEHSKIIVREDGEFLVISEVLKQALAERFISLVQEHCSKEGLKTEASFDNIRLS